VTGRRALATAAAGWLTTAGFHVARAADAPSVPALTDTAAAEVAPPDEEIAIEEPATGASPQAAPLVVTGYVDVGFAKAQGNGTSFHPADNRSPLDYGVDPFAPAVNSRGEVASTDPGIDPNGTPRFVNGFLPRSAGIGGTPSFLLNTANVDFRYTSAEIPVMVFTRMQMVPRLENTGETTRLFLEQAFGRISPIKSAELAISIGKFDSVFGIEYLDNQANFRIGITPSLFARYTTGTSIGVKAFYRYQIIPIASALSLNVAATNSGTFVESLQGSSRSLTGVPVVAARVGYELNLARLSVKVGASAERGPRNDQNDRGTMQTLFGADARVFIAGLSLSGEFVKVDEQEGNPDKLTGLGTYTFTSDFYAQGFWAQAAYELPLPIAPVRVTPYARYERRHGEFVSFAAITVDRLTAGLNVGVGDSLIVKGEYLINRELDGAPTVANNVVTSSVVWTW